MTRASRRLRAAAFGTLSAFCLVSMSAAQTLQPDDVRVPLHTMPDDPIGGAYGLWTAGSNYKASFHDGFCFYPYRGAQGSTVRMQWHTESIRRGARDLLGPRPEAHTTEWRHELRHSGVSEVYDVQTKGIEQSFVLHHEPAGDGDVVVVGRIASELDLPVAAAAVQSLVFTENGEPIVKYGRALAFDAAGRRVDVTTACDGERITLRLPDSFVETASFPVTIDPLTSAVSIAFNLSGAPLVRTAMVADNGQVTGQVMVVFSRQVSANDTDVWGYLYDKNMATVGNTFAFSDITANWDTTEFDTCRADRTNRFVIAFQRQFNSTTSAIRIYLHDDSSTVHNSGPLLSASPASGRQQRNPQLSGGGGSSENVMLICEDDPIGSGAYLGTRIKARPIDTNTDTVGAEFDVNNTLSNHDVERPAIISATQTVLPNTTVNQWVVAFITDRTLTHGNYYVQIARMDSSGVSAINMIHSTTDIVDSVKIDGSWDGYVNGRFLVSWIRRTSGFVSGRVEALRVDLDVNYPTTLGPLRTVVASSPILGDLDLAYDYQTRSHWTVTYSQTTSPSNSSVSIARLGGTGAVVESSLMESSDHPGELSVAFSRQIGGDRFLTCYGLEDQFETLKGRQFTYDPGAGYSVYGAGCNGAQIAVTDEPYAGHGLFGFILIGPMTTSPTLGVFAIGFQPANLPTPWPGCQLLVDPITSVFVYSTVSFVRFDLPLPDAPLLIGDIYVQGGILNPLSVSPGLEVRIR